MMKNLFCILLSVLCVFSLCSCGVICIDDSKEQTAYKNAIATLFDALDNKDEEAVYRLFSPAVREQDNDMKDQIRKLMSVYEGPTDEIGWDGLLASSASYEDGESSIEAYAMFPVRSGDVYFWCYLKVMCENTSAEKQVGVVQLDFYTADECCIFRYDENAKNEDSVGLEVYAEKTLEEEVRCISGWPHKYSSSTKALNMADVDNFFKTSNRFADFKARFGEPNAEHIFTYYELPQENSKPRYLELGMDGDTILVARIVDDFMYVKTVFDEENQ